MLEAIVWVAYVAIVLPLFLLPRAGRDARRPRARRRHAAAAPDPSVHVLPAPSREPPPCPRSAPRRPSSPPRLARPRRLHAGGETGVHRRAAGAVAGGPIAVTATDDACEVAAAEAAGRHDHVHDQQHRHQGHRVLPLRRGRPDHGRGREHRPGPDPRAHRRGARAAATYKTACKPGMVGDGIRAAVHRDRHGPVGARTPTRSSPRPPRATSATSTAQADALLARTQEFVDAGQGRRRREGQGAVPDRPDLLGADRAGGRVVRRHRPEDRRPRGRRSRRACSSPATTGSRRTCGSTACSPTPPAIADQLLADVNDDRRAGEATVELTAVQLANGAKELLDEVATGKITGEEDRYSHTDLWDFKANVEGSQAAVAALRPVIDRAQPDLAAALDERFTAVDDAARAAPRR